MYRGMLSLYVLLTTPIPVPWGFFAKAAVMILAYVAFYPHDGILRSFGISAIQVSVVIGLLTTMVQNMPVLVSEMGRESKTYPSIIALYTAICGAVIFAPHITWIQHGVSLCWALYGLFFGAIAVFKRDMLQEFNWGGRNWPVGQGNAARWNILRFFALAVANEALVANTTSMEWLIGYALLPIVFHALYWWTVIATHPYD